MKKFLRAVQLAQINRQCQGAISIAGSGSMIVGAKPAVCMYGTAYD